MSNNKSVKESVLAFILAILICTQLFTFEVKKTSGNKLIATYIQI